MIERKGWKEFKETGLLWWINRSLHLFGWAIVFEEADDGTVITVYPARVKFRGFSEDVEEKGFENVTDYLKTSCNKLREEIDG